MVTGHIKHCLNLTIVMREKILSVSHSQVSMLNLICLDVM